MIKFSCIFCGARLEADDSLSGTQMPCASCGKLVSVPLSEHDLAKRERQEGEAPYQLLVAGFIFGILLIVAGIITASAFMDMDIGSGNIANLDKMNQRLCGIILAVGLFVAGIFLLGVTAMNSLLRRIADRGAPPPSTTTRIPESREPPAGELEKK